MGTSLIGILTLVPWLQVAAPTPQQLSAELVLIGGTAERLGPDCGLGDGGVTQTAKIAIRGTPGECASPGGALVQCRREGVKLTLPSGRELLFAPDGFLHLRGGEVAGPFQSGVELFLLDGSSIQILRASSRRFPLQTVQMVYDRKATQLWSSDGVDFSPTDCQPWSGDRLWCFGAGDSLYRAVALGPLITLCRVLVPADQAQQMPTARLLLAVDQVVGSLGEMMTARPKRIERETTPELRAVVDAAATIFVADEHAPPRVSREALRYALRRGFELSFELDGIDLRMGLCRSGSSMPMISWHLGYGADVAYAIKMIRLDKQDQTFERMSRPVKLPHAAMAVAARSERRELAVALSVVHSLQRDRVASNSSATATRD
jgi:hypothetical protein